METTITLIKKFHQFSYFDGLLENGIFSFKEDIWLSSSEYRINKNVTISVIDDNNFIKFGVFLNIEGSKLRILSTFQSPKVGFNLLDLQKLSVIFNLPISNIDSYGSQKLYYSYRVNEAFNIIYQKYNQKEYILIASIAGGRGAENLYVHDCWEVELNKDFKDLYFNQ